MTFQVVRTNDSSCLSKCSAAKHGYFEDDFLQYFVTKCPRRSPLIHLGYSIRSSIINSLVEKFLTVTDKSNETQVISIGAGFDTVFFKLKKKYPWRTTVYYELDLPKVVERKIVCIKQSETLRNIIGDFTECDGGLVSTYYNLLVVDLRDIKAVKALFQKFKINVVTPTLFLSECAITYLEERKSSRIVELASRFENATFITYEQIHPDDGFGQVMLKHFESLQSPLLSVLKHPTLKHQTHRYINNGWDHCTSLSALDAYIQLVSDKERQRVLTLEPFDEWEEFYLKCIHYVVAIASKGSLHDWSTLRRKLLLSKANTLTRTLEWKLTSTQNVSRYGHCVVRRGNDLLLVGGFGVGCNGSHSRLKGIKWLKRNDDGSWKVTKELEGDKWATMYSTWTPVTADSYIVYGGRKSPVQCTDIIPSLVTVHDDGSVSSVPVVEVFDTCISPPRWRHTAVVARWQNIPTFVVFGGRTCALKLLNDTWLLPLESGNKEVVTLPELADKPCARFSHSAAVRQTSSGNDAVWVFGGMGQDGPLGDLWCLDLSTLSWRPSITTLIPRAGHSSSVYNNQLILVGGFGSLDDCQPGITVVDLMTEASMEFQLPNMSPEKPIMLINHCHVIFEDREELLIVGGGGNCFSFGTFFNSHICSVKLNDLVCK